MTIHPQEQGRSTVNWSTQQLAEFLALVSSCTDPGDAACSAVEQAVEALDAKAGALVRDDVLEASVGFPDGHVPHREIAALTGDAHVAWIDVPGVGQLCAVSVALDDDASTRLVIARRGDTGFEPEELGLLRAMGRVLVLTLRMLRGLAAERSLREGAERERAEREHAEEAYRRLVERLPAIVYRAEVGEVGAWTYVSPQIESILGFTPEEWCADPALWERRLHPDDRDRAIADEQAAALGATVGSSDYRMLARDGRVVWLADDAVLESDDRGRQHWHGVLYDISDRKRAEAELELRAAQQAAVAQLGQSALEGQELAGLMHEAVATAAAILGIECAHVLELRSGPEVFIARATAGWPEDAGSVTIPNSRESLAGFTIERGARTTVRDWAAEQRFAQLSALHDRDLRSGLALIIDGPERPFGVLELHSQRLQVFSEEDVNFVQSLANVLAEAIDRRAAEDEMRRRALHDPLTLLPNRTLFGDRLAHALLQSRRRGSLTAVLFCDIDHFKLINDSLGHAAGDELLTGVAPRLKEALRPGDTVARFGGDEFSILVEDLDDEREAVEVAERIGALFTRPFVLSGIEHFVTASVGIAIAREPGVRPETLIRDADAAMYRAKERGRGRYEVFDQVMRARAVERLQLENELRRAIGRDELRVHYQPIVSLETAKVVAFEALVRWQHPRRGLIAPADFIPTAEESGAIEALGRWVLERACRQAAGWHAESPDAFPVGMSVNLSARQVSQADLVGLVAEMLTSTGLDPSSLSLEITESALVEESGASVENLTALRKMGVRLVIDDFGTGYSSLSYLRRFPLDAIKIDRSFVEGLGIEQDSAAIVDAIIAMARALSLGVIAEGVETALQIEELKRLGCRQAQGFFFATPLPASETQARMATGYSGRWQTASTLLPSGSNTNAP
jgi:diguanylate cyclase (GGDEF)-like protein/PAS domain S-box-containing protein